MSQFEGSADLVSNKISKARVVDRRSLCELSLNLDMLMATCAAGIDARHVKVVPQPSKGLSMNAPKNARVCDCFHKTKLK